MNPCPCGFHGDPKRECLCLDIDVERYRKKISGPLLDRLDCQIILPSVSMGEATQKESLSTEELKEGVLRARHTQAQRFKKFPWTLNALIPPKYVEACCEAEPQAKKLLMGACNRFGWSLRVYHRLLKMGRTLADLEGAELIREGDISQAIGLRLQF